ncbi:uncharacterized protein C8R40DRAFT_1065024 [Lentinula edodes]|uniref:uncharacterized protein n=1 Tax=Lentinula edodes TaxID=5353 RepID=UPI001E8EEB21|nr:uncharacterized protein C8R40DRAFT_1065024 [Lentinula edodes]KAH7881331.1 hypothetical protein C8R40DRAFT_1065024 [Lentinula edodes]
MTDWKFHFSFNTDGTTKYIKLPAVNLNADVVQERLHSPEITTNYVEKELPGNDSLVALIQEVFSHKLGQSPIKLNASCRALQEGLEWGEMVESKDVMWERREGDQKMTRST